MIKVLVVDDQKILAEGIKSVIEISEELDVIGIAYDGIEALSMIKKSLPDVVLLDIRMPNMNGVITTKEIKSSYPDVKVIILTTFDDSEYILNAINYGASGYLLKDVGGDALIDAIKSAHKGDTILPVKIAKKITDAAKLVSSDKEIKLKKAYSFSDREVQVALMIFEGFTNRQIASALNISEGTVRNYISAIYEKIGAENRIDAINKMADLIKF